MKIKQKLEQQLADFLKCKALDWNKGISNKQTFWCRDAKLRVEQHYDLKADYVVVDKMLGVIGIVQVLNEGVEHKVIESHIEKAVYFRHLLAGKQKGYQHFKVELVLVGSEAIIKQVSNSLQLMMANTNYLYAIGVNVLTYWINKGQLHCRPKDMRRAFCWLLQASQQFFSYPNQSENEGFKSIKLQDYRLQGERIFELGEHSSMHLVHGHNGSGKSTLVEAMELCISGQIARFEQRKGRHSENFDYGEHLRNHDTKADLCITIACSGVGEDEVYRLAKTAENSILSPCAGTQKQVKANGFRLDQPLMDQLTRIGSAERARVFLDAYFPDAKTLIEKLHIVERQKSEYTTQLEKALSESSIVNRDNWQDYRWVLDDNKVINTIADEFFPIARKDIKYLVNFSLQVNSTVNPWLENKLTVKTLMPCIKNLTYQLRSIENNAQQYIVIIAIAKDVLERLTQWRPTSTNEVSADYPNLLNDWLEIEVLLKLAEQQQLVIKTITETKETDKALNDKLTPCFSWLDVKQLPEIKAKLAEWQKIKDVRLNSVLAVYEQLNSENPKEKVENDQEPAKISIEINEVELLNSVGIWLFGEQTNERFGDVIYRCVLGNMRRKYADVTIGSKAWLKPIFNDLEQMIAVLKALDEGVDGEQFGLAKLIVENHLELDKLNQQIVDLESQINQSFKQRISDMEGPLNELMALFTPARWAYQDIKISHQSESQEHGGVSHKVDITIGEDDKSKVDSSLIFNTAELNLFTLALFLLCARNIDNPYKVMVWDDPLQNMDELTATTLARGMAKLINLWHQKSEGKDNWQMILFFHGRDDLERFRHEISANIYHLPWLSPVGEKGNNEIKAEQPMFVRQMQDLSKFIEDIS